VQDYLFADGFFIRKAIQGNKTPSGSADSIGAALFYGKLIKKARPAQERICSRAYQSEGGAVYRVGHSRDDASGNRAQRS
jgi:hypothetical protein